jgi:hypothetical protein
VKGKALEVGMWGKGWWSRLERKRRRRVDFKKDVKRLKPLNSTLIPSFLFFF